MAIVASACAAEDDFDEPPPVASPSEPVARAPQPDPAPAVESVVPLLGHYGTEIEVKGKNLADYTLTSPAPNGVAMEIASLGWGGGSGRIAFPATGELFIVSNTNPTDPAPLGRFSPTWLPNAPIAAPTAWGRMWDLDGELVFVSSAENRTIRFDVLGAKPRSATTQSGMPIPTTIEAFRDWRSAYRVANGRIEMVDMTSTRIELTVFDGTMATTTAFDPPADPIIGVGFDDLGFAIVTKPTASTVQRYRAGGAPALAAVGDPVPLPPRDEVDELLECGVAGSTVVCVRGYDVHTFLDDYAVFQISALPASETTFGAWTPLGGGDDYATRITLSPLDGALAIETCITDTGFHVPEVSCGRRITFDGKGAIFEKASPRLVGGDYSMGTLAYATCREDGVLMLRWGIGPTTLAAKAKEQPEPSIYPCDQNELALEALLPSGDGSPPRIVLSTVDTTDTSSYQKTATYVATRRP